MKNSVVALIFHKDHMENPIDIILGVSRKNDHNDFGLVGGSVEENETFEEAIIREVKEETGLDIELKGISGVYSDPDRDPRGHTVTICYKAQKTGGKLRADSDAQDVACIKLEEALTYKLAFDHEQILKDAFSI